MQNDFRCASACKGARYLQAINVRLDHVAALGIQIQGLVETSQSFVQAPELLLHFAHLQ
jgi:hypothetical protein